ncbi:MAG: hypothetical protein ABEI52_00085, partial [Halobacteriaceae archaeon]
MAIFGLIGLLGGAAVGPTPVHGHLADQLSSQAGVSENHYESSLNFSTVTLKPESADQVHGVLVISLGGNASSGSRQTVLSLRVGQSGTTRAVYIQTTARAYLVLEPRELAEATSHLYSQPQITVTGNGTTSLGKLPKISVLRPQEDTIFVYHSEIAVNQDYEVVIKLPDGKYTRHPVAKSDGMLRVQVPGSVPLSKGTVTLYTNESTGDKKIPLTGLSFLASPNRVAIIRDKTTIDPITYSGPVEGVWISNGSSRMKVAGEQIRRTKNGTIDISKSP